MLRSLRTIRAFANMTKAPPKNPLIAVIGATGTGKSQLAVEIAKRHNGEIVNGDAMQLYAGLPVITNKITVEEQQGVPHHLLGCIGLREQPWVVGTFVKKALGVIEEIRSRGRLPILVGGTHYYTQSLLFRDRLAGENDSENLDTGKGFVKDTTETWPVLQQPTNVLLEELKKVDPVMAERWHPNDRRKIVRSLEIYLQTGKKASDIYAEQRNTQHSQSGRNGDVERLDGLTMRCPTLLFWVHADNDILRARLDKRVDAMLEQGLLNEVSCLNAFAESQVRAGHAVDETRGIWVSIGYKEFKPYMEALEDCIQEAHQFERMKAEALERTKVATRQYAKRQIRWIRIKLVNALTQAGASKNLYLLDGSDVSAFDQDVVAPALQLTQDFLTASNALPDPTSLSDAAAELLSASRDYDLAATPEKWMRQHCELCGVTCVTEEQWKMHLKSKGHRKKARPAKAHAAGPRIGTNEKSNRNGEVIDGSGALDDNTGLSEVGLEGWDEDQDFR